MNQKNKYLTTFTYGRGSKWYMGYGSVLLRLGGVRSQSPNQRLLYKVVDKLPSSIGNIPAMDQWLEKKKRPSKNDIKSSTKEKKSKKDKKSPIVLTEDDYHWGLDWDQSEAFGNKVDPSTMSVNNRYRNMMGIMGLCPDWLLRLMVTLISIACWYNVYVGLFVRQSV